MHTSMWRGSGLGENGSYLQMNWLSLKNNRLKLETSGELSIVLDGSIEYTSYE